MIEADFRCLFRKQKGVEKRQNERQKAKRSHHYEADHRLFHSVHSSAHLSSSCLSPFSSVLLFIYCQSHPRKGQRMETREEYGARTEKM